MVETVYNLVAIKELFLSHNKFTQPFLIDLLRVIPDTM